MTVIGLIYFYIIYYIKRTQNTTTFQQNRQQSIQRDITVFRRILILLGLLFMVAFPSTIMYVYYLITGHLFEYIVQFQWLTFTLALSMLPIITVFITPNLRNLFNLLFRANARIQPISSTQQRIG